MADIRTTIHWRGLKVPLKSSCFLVFITTNEAIEAILSPKIPWPFGHFYSLAAFLRSTDALAPGQHQFFRSEQAGKPCQQARLIGICIQTSVAYFAVTESYTSINNTPNNQALNILGQIISLLLYQPLDDLIQYY
ncbi:MAG: hypothetical protein CSA09_03990 [Candidatus Contendobacter odensis]|uniref:Uncharacterized protein n=1 Tax=Candidatus Contendibacter odensensis TaxID=1400860 RepID=A0A2G6PFD8_9GAMM|nr:MAG: hypothetical protein CSA09_03990 [Candidatus Contendobacter odensis]